MRHQFFLGCLFLLIGFTPQPRWVEQSYFYRLYFSPRCKYSMKIADAWEHFKQEKMTSMWNCQDMLCRFPTPTLMIFNHHTIEDIHVGSDAILEFIQQFNNEV